MRRSRGLALWGSALGDAPAPVAHGRSRRGPSEACQRSPREGWLSRFLNFFLFFLGHAHHDHPLQPFAGPSRME